MMRAVRLVAAVVLMGGVASAAPFGMVGKITAKPGQRDALVAVLVPKGEPMPGNRAYLVAKDLKDTDVIWVTEAWDSREAHAASLKLPAVRTAIGRGMPLIAGFETIAETEPAGR